MLMLMLQLHHVYVSTYLLRVDYTAHRGLLRVMGAVSASFFRCALFNYAVSDVEASAWSCVRHAWRLLVRASAVSIMCDDGVYLTCRGEDRRGFGSWRGRLLSLALFLLHHYMYSELYSPTSPLGLCALSRCRASKRNIYSRLQSWCGVGAGCLTPCPCTWVTPKSRPPDPAILHTFVFPILRKCASLLPRIPQTSSSLTKEEIVDLTSPARIVSIIPFQDWRDPD